MAQLILNVGTNNNDKTGDTLRAGGLKIKANFLEIYNALSNDGLNISGGNLLKTGGWSDIRNKPNFVALATSGEWNDIAGKPNLVIQKAVPNNPIGTSGHLAGDLAYDGTNLYVAVADYDGTTQIWKTIPWGGSAGTTGDWTWPDGGTQALLGGSQNSSINGQSPGGLLLHNDYTITLNAGDKYLSMNADGSLGFDGGGSISETPAEAILTLSQFGNIPWTNTNVYTRISETEYQALPDGPTITRDGSGLWSLGYNGTDYYVTEDRHDWDPTAAGVGQIHSTLSAASTNIRTSNNSTWAFDNDRTLTLPANGILRSANETFTLYSQQLNSYTRQYQGPTSWGVYPEDDSGEHDAWAWIELSLFNKENPKIKFETVKASDGIINHWEFNEHGSTILPLVIGGDTSIGTVFNTNPPGHTLTLKHNNGVSGGSGGELKFDYGNIKLKVVKDAGITKIWEFDTDGSITLPSGSVIDETSTTLVLTPPTALAGQGLVIRTTVGGGLSTADTFTPGGSVTVTFTDQGSHLSTGGYVDGSESNTWAYTITGISEADLGSPLTGSFLAENWGIPYTGLNTITFNIPAESQGTGFTITLDKIITDPPYYLSGISLNGDGRIELTVGSVVNPEISHVHLTTADPTTVDLYLGDDNQYVKIEKDGGGVVIGTDGNTHRWTFDNEGILNLPQNSAVGAAVIQPNAASFGIKLISNGNIWTYGTDGRTTIPHGINGPSTARGSAGDTAGTILVSGAYLFYCYADYTDGSTPIWQKVAMDNTDWD